MMGALNRWNRKRRTVLKATGKEATLHRGDGSELTVAKSGLHDGYADIL